MAKNYQASVHTALSPSQFLMLASLSMDDLKWEHHFHDNNRIEAERRQGQNTQLITVAVDGSEVKLESKYRQWALSDGGRNRRDIEQLLSAIESRQAIHTPEELDNRFVTLKAEAQAAAEDLERRIQTGELTAAEKISLGIGGHQLTYTLIGINILVFVLMVISGAGLFEPETGDLLKWGANYRPYTLGGDWWRLVTANFVHIGLIHLLFNMYALFSIGVYLEPLLGKVKLAVAYLATGVLAAVTSTWYHHDTVSAGASGAIFGLYGLFLALLTTKMLDKETRDRILKGIVVFIGYNLLYGFKSGIDNSAHAGGLLSGLVLGYLYYFLHKKSRLRLFPGLVITGVVTITGIFVGSQISDDRSFLQAMDKVYILEEKALAPLKDAAHLSEDEFIRDVRTVSLPAWTEAARLVKSCEDQQLSAKLVEHRKLMSGYVQLRIQQSNELMEAVKTGDWTQANATSEKIDKVLLDMEKLFKS